jgi:hypothetical protein
VIKIRSAHFVSLPAWHALHSVGEIVYDGSANDDKSFFRMLQRESPIRVPEAPSAFHRLGKRSAFRRPDVRLQSRSFARENQSLRRGIAAPTQGTVQTASLQRLSEESNHCAIELFVEGQTIHHTRYRHPAQSGIIELLCLRVASRDVRRG